MLNECRAVGDCFNAKCDGTHDLECYRGQCTCVNPFKVCLFDSDCSGTCTAFGRHRRYYCITAKCRCFAG
ncbi:serine protease inhibitor Cvsi-2-like [Ostrea edulis]|uniref:serine protease inhibitor Cvsi-2-like n=1 Tax=Ostrea edulis TaxID=37623 RepID=UPI0020955DA3|nr:serine protease inhibitor Cvsi-2-like [Ostrea edulis]